MQKANLQCLLGIQCNDFTMIAADRTKTMSIAIMKHDSGPPILLLPIPRRRSTQMRRALGQIRMLTTCLKTRQRAQEIYTVGAYREKLSALAPPLPPLNVLARALRAYNHAKRAKAPLNEEKIYELSDRLLLGVNGDSGDAVQFSQFVAKNIQLYKIRNGYELSTAAAAHFTRKSLADTLRCGEYQAVNLLMGGYNEAEGAQLYFLDFLATCVKVPFASHGFGGLFSIGILDKYYKPDLTETEAYDVIKLCVKEIHQRLFLNLPSFHVKVVSKDGVTTLPVITETTIVE